MSSPFRVLRATDSPPVISCHHLSSDFSPSLTPYTVPTPGSYTRISDIYTCVESCLQSESLYKITARRRRFVPYNADHTVVLIGKVGEKSSGVKAAHRDVYLAAEGSVLPALLNNQSESEDLK